LVVPNGNKEENRGKEILASFFFDSMYEKRRFRVKGVFTLAPVVTENLNPQTVS
jgi:hypothetical protein